jgi:DNA-binding PadR family transcriptional regulator
LSKEDTMYTLTPEQQQQLKEIVGDPDDREDWLTLEHRTSYDLMKEIKMLLDPKNLMNPGNIFI